MEENIVDVWMQHPCKKFMTEEMFESLFRWNRIDPKVFQDEHYPLYRPDFTLKSMDKSGIEKGLICAWYGPKGPMITNEQVLELCRAHPTRFAGVASADIRDPVKAVRQIRHYVKDCGFVAVRILPWLWEKCPSDRLFYPIYAECVQLGVPLCLQVGQTGPLRSSEMGRPIPYLERVALDFPDLVIVGGHIGDPWVREMIYLCTKFPNIYIDTSAYKPSRYPSELVAYMRGRGSKKVLFGSNYPMLDHQSILAQLGVLKLSPKASSAFLRENAQRVFKLNNDISSRKDLKPDSHL